MDTFKLSKKDKDILYKWGYKNSDFNRIEEFTNKGIFINETSGDVMTWKTAHRFLGKEEFLSGISRAAFHWTAMREHNSHRVYIDFSNSFF